jgi:hypothetical protein
LRLYREKKKIWIQYNASVGACDPKRKRESVKEFLRTEKRRAPKESAWKIILLDAVHPSLKEIFPK